MTHESAVPLPAGHPRYATTRVRSMSVKPEGPLSHCLLLHCVIAPDVVLLGSDGEGGIDHVMLQLYRTRIPDADLVNDTHLCPDPIRGQRS